jgi:hypothetical protein
LLRFSANGEDVEITGKSSLLMKSEAGTVWIYHVPEARTKGRADGVDITCSGDVDLLNASGAAERRIDPPSTFLHSVELPGGVYFVGRV